MKHAVIHGANNQHTGGHAFLILHHRHLIVIGIQGVHGELGYGGEVN